jgi:hypothetical protein
MVYQHTPAHFEHCVYFYKLKGFRELLAYAAYTEQYLA